MADPDAAPPPGGPTRGWVRVTRRRPCPVCGKPDWCGIAADGGAVACMRIDAGSLRRLRNGAWLHKRRVDLPPDARPEVPRDDPVLTAERIERLMGRYRSAASPARLGRLAADLGLSSPWPLGQLGVGWSHFHPGWAFPMLDADRRLTGVQVRRHDGTKRQVRGSRLGLFLPRGLSRMPRDVPLVICEGASDAAAALDLADRFRGKREGEREGGRGDEHMPWRPVGRASCAGGQDMVAALVDRLHPIGRAEIVVVADADEAGRRGAAELAEALRTPARDVRVLVPAAAEGKDLRARVVAGLTPATFAAAVGGD